MYDFYIRGPFFKHRHQIEASSYEEALTTVRSRYGVTDEKFRQMYFIDVCWNDNEKLVTNKRLWED